MGTTGKIFPESSNIYQDQAKVLFNYYQQAAERIVQEEERIEGEIQKLESERAMLNEQIGKLWLPWLVPFAVLLFGIIVYLVKKNQLTKEIEQLDGRINEYRKMHDEIFRDYKVTKLGVAYVPVADQIKYEDKSFIVDYTGSVDQSHVVLQLSRQSELLSQTITEIDNLSKDAPIVETSEEPEPVETYEYSTSIQEINQNDYFGKLDRSLRTVSFCMNDLDSAAVALPLVQDRSEHLQHLNEFATSELPENASVVNIFNKAVYQDDINKFKEINKLKDALSSETEQFEDVLRNLMKTMASSVQAVSSLKLASTDMMVDNSNRLLYKLLKAPFNHYSQHLEGEEIERIRNEQFDYTDAVQGYQPFTLRQSSRVKYNPVTDNWTAEDGSTEIAPFGIHQIYEEIVAPMVQTLMQENRVERLKIYNHIKDQKLSYLNKWHQDTDAFYRDNRGQSADLINLMQESLREYVAAYNTLISFQKTQESMEQSNNLDNSVVEGGSDSEQTLLAFEQQAKQFEAVQADFEAFMDRLKDDIDDKAAEFGHIEYYDARLRDGHSNEAAIAMNEVPEMEERRKALSAINPLLAKKSELLPEPNIEEITMEHLSINLPAMAANALDDLNSVEVQGVENSESEAPNC